LAQNRAQAVSQDSEGIAMTVLIGLLRAVNVGGTGKLPMDELKAMCREIGFDNPRTYIASGNVVFGTDLAPEAAKQALEDRLEIYAGKRVGVAIRTQQEMEAVLKGNPFPDGAPNRVLAIFLDTAPPPDTLSQVTHKADEEIALGTREIYVHYGDGMGQSKLKIPAAKDGTARNMNTVKKMVEMAADSG
jgi:uncharacterized protein (DUF1697 family)